MQDFSISPKQMAELVRLAQSPQGKELIALLNQSSGAKIRQALEEKNYSLVRSLAEQFLSEARAAELLDQLGK